MVNHICEPISPKSARILSLNLPGARWGQKTAYDLHPLSPNQQTFKLPHSPSTFAYVGAPGTGRWLQALNEFEPPPIKSAARIREQRP
jgi:hypothetical protein